MKRMMPVKFCHMPMENPVRENISMVRTSPITAVPIELRDVQIRYRPAQRLAARKSATLFI